MDAAGLSRRHATLLAFGALIFGKAAIPAAATTTSPFLPDGKCLLSRKLMRGLHDGQAVTVERSWLVSFVRQSRGIAISGEQVSVNVDAPANLAPLAKIERERSTGGLFPILLAPDGIIIAAGQNTTQASFDAAVRTAETMLAQKEGEPAAGAKHAGYLAKLQLAGSSLLDELPGDLFYPATQPFRDIRRIALPDGSSGEFEVSWQASVRSRTNLLETARREVITRIGSSERRSSEDWGLTAL